MPIIPGTQCNGQYIDYEKINTSQTLDFSYENFHSFQNGSILYGKMVDTNNRDIYIVGIDAETLEVLFSKKLHIPPHTTPDGYDDFPSHFYMAGNGGLVLDFNRMGEDNNSEAIRDILLVPNQTKDGINVLFDLEIYTEDINYAHPMELVYSPEYGAYISTNQYDNSLGFYVESLFKIEDGNHINHIFTFKPNGPGGAILVNLVIYENYIMAFESGLFFWDITSVHPIPQQPVIKGDFAWGGQVYFVHNGVIYARSGEEPDETMGALVTYDINANEMKMSKFLSYMGKDIKHITLPSFHGKDTLGDEVLLVKPTTLQFTDESWQNTVMYFYKNGNNEVLKATSFNGNYKQPIFASVRDKRITLLGDCNYNNLIFYPIKYTNGFDLCNCASQIEYEWKNVSTFIENIPIDLSSPPINANFLDTDITIEDFDFSWEIVQKYTWCGSHPFFAPFARTFTPYGADIRLARGGVV